MPRSHRTRRAASDRATPELFVVRADERAEQVVTEVYERHAAAISAYALRRAAAADAADVVADTFLVAWRRHGDMPSPVQHIPCPIGI